MAQINRFSRPTQVAKFDPLSAQEIMAIPLMKQEMEDKQIAENRDVLKQLYSTEAVGADQARVNARRTEMENKLKGIAEDIATTGISRKKTSAFNKLKTEFDKEMSLSGDIGHANAFVAKEKAAKNNFYNWAVKSGWDKDKIDHYWAKHAAKQSAFGAEGFNTEYQELGLPTFVEPEELLMQQAKALGSITRRDARGVDVTSNTDNVSHAVSLLMKKFRNPETPEGRLAALEEWDLSAGGDIESKLIRQGNAMASVKEDYSNNDALGKIARKTEADAAKSIIAQNEITGEKVWDVSPGLLRTAGFEETKEKTDEAFAKLQDIIADKDTTPEERQEAEESYLLKKKIYNQAEDYFATTTKGRSYRRGINEAISENPKFFEAMEKGEEPTKSKGGEYRIKDSKGEWKYASAEEVDKYKKAKGLYTNSFFETMTTDTTHFQEKELVFQGSGIKDPANRRKYEVLTDAIKNQISQNSGELNIVNAGELLEGDLNIAEELEDSGKDVKFKEQIFNVMSLNKDNIEVISHVPGNARHAPGFRVKFTVPTMSDAQRKKNNLFGDLEGRVFDMVIEVNPQGGGSAKNLVTEKMAFTDDGAILASKNADYYEYGNFTPTMGQTNDYYNDDDIKQRYLTTGIGRKFIGSENAKIDIFKDDESGTFKVKKLDKKGLTEELSYSEMLESMPVDQGAQGILSWLVSKGGVRDIALEKIKNTPEYLQAESNGVGKEYIFNEIVKLKNNDSSVETAYHVNLLKIL